MKHATRNWAAWGVFFIKKTLLRQELLKWFLSSNVVLAIYFRPRTFCEHLELNRCCQSIFLTQNASFSCWGCVCHQSRYPAHVVISLHKYYLSKKILQWTLQTLRCWFHGFQFSNTNRWRTFDTYKAIPYHTRILTETGTKINFRFRYRRKWTLTRRKSPTDLKKILVGRLECRFPDGNEIHSCRLHQSNGNLFEHVKFYILPTFYTLIGWTLMKMRLNFNW